MKTKMKEQWLHMELKTEAMSESMTSENFK
jgi:hypothetical protein